MDTSSSDAPPPSEPLILTKGMGFPDSKAALHYVQDVALSHNKRVKVASRGGNHRRVVCASDAADSAACPFFVQLYQHNSKTDRTWYASSFELTHAPDCSSTGKPTQRQIAAMSQFQQALQQEPNATATQLLAKVERGGGNANIRTIYRAKQETKRALLDRLHASYNEIPALLASFMALNPGSLAAYEVDNEEASSEPSSSTNTKLFISCGVFTASTAFNQQIYGLECVPFTHKQLGLQGVQLFLFGKDSNLETVTLGAAVCGAPSRANYQWFFTKVEQAGVKNLRVCPILCGSKDPHLLSLEVELGLTLRLCTRSIIESDLAGFRGFKAYHHDLIWGLQRSENEQQVNERLEWIGASCGSAVETYLRQQIAIERWVVAGNLRKASLYGWRSRDFHEPTDSTDDTVASRLIESLRDASLVTFLERMMAHFVEAAFERSRLATKWRISGQIVTDRAAELYETQRKRSSEYDVTLASDTLAFVTRKSVFGFASSAASVSSPLLTPVHRRRRHRVDLGVNSCTCAFLDQFALPCRHLIAVLLASCSQQSRESDDRSRVYSRFAPGYLVETFARAFEGKRVELPLAASVQEHQTTDERPSLPSASNQPVTAAVNPAPPSGSGSGSGSTSSNKKLKRSKAAAAASSGDSASTSKRKPGPHEQAQKAQTLRTCRNCAHGNNLVQGPSSPELLVLAESDGSNNNNTVNTVC